MYVVYGKAALFTVLLQCDIGGNDGGLTGSRPHYYHE